MSNPTATLNFPVPSALGTIDQYVTAVNKYPLLTPSRSRSSACAGSTCRTSIPPASW